ncbi:MAG: hypothetical protein MJ198_10795 [Bacteroidales bacterium]|nr:hypothetical protein [Bacteroidales bacterium]
MEAAVLNINDLRHTVIDLLYATTDVDILKNFCDTLKKAISSKKEKFVDTQTEDFIKEFAGCMAAEEEEAFNSVHKECKFSREINLDLE